MIHQYKLNGYNIVLDTCSGGIHVVDDVAYDIISLFESTDKTDTVKKMSEKYEGRDGVTLADIEECYDQVAELKNMGKLFAPDTFENMAGKLKEKTLSPQCPHL